jgi:thioredoxin 1
MTKGLLYPVIAMLLAVTKKADGFATSLPHIRTRTSLSASRYLTTIEDSNFRELFCGDEYLLVDCCAQWCGPCKLIEPTLEEAAKKWKDNLVVGKYDVESKNDQVKVELLLQGVMPQALPALILIHKNKVLTTWKGVIQPQELNALLDKHINNAAAVGYEEQTRMAISEPRPPRKKSGLISFATVGAEDEYMLKQR